MKIEEKTTKEGIEIEVSGGIIDNSYRLFISEWEWDEEDELNDGNVIVSNSNGNIEVNRKYKKDSEKWTEIMKEVTKEILSR